jgi:hypothetical protein
MHYTLLIIHYLSIYPNFIPFSGDKNQFFLNEAILLVKIEPG